MKRKTAGPTPVKRPYRSPELKVHGDFRKLTSDKAGINSDGPGKPKTKTSGPNE
jgi:hypothetical protein